MDTSPTVENQIQDQRANAGGEAIEIDLGEVFAASSGGALAYSASSSDEAVAPVTINSAMLMVTPQEGGEAEITVTASNEQGEATDTFGVRVFADPPDRPN